MSPEGNEYSAPDDSDAGSRHVRETRIDAPHVLGSREKTSVEGVGAPAREAITASAESAAVDRNDPACFDAPIAQVQLQARQLSSRLETRQRELDHREAQLDVQRNELERAQQEVRLWVDESRRALEHRDAQLSASEGALARREARRRILSLRRGEDTPEPQEAANDTNRAAPRSDEFNLVRVELMEQRRRLSEQVVRLRSWFHHRYESLARREDEVRKLETRARGEQES